jgi:tight adherence protein C
MTFVVMTGLGLGVGVVGVITGLRTRKVSLQGLLADLAAEPRSVDRRGPLSGQTDAWRLDRRMAAIVADSVRQRGIFERELAPRLALSNVLLEDLVTRCIVYAGVGLIVPIVMWMVLTAAGVHLPLLISVGAVGFSGIGASLLPITKLNADAKRGMQLAKKVICSFLDLVVLGLAGGMGIESALLAAAQLGENVVSRRLLAALSLARDTGTPPWEALARLGDTLGIDELGELAATVGLAGMEGAKIRSTLAARAATIRRHELANAEAEANALTERLFIPGAFLLVGFLLFIGYPAFSRIASGF